jgi:hypothetical protein
MVVCKNNDAFNIDAQRPKSLRRIDYLFYRCSVPFDLSAWAALKVVFTTSLPLIAIARYVPAPVLSLQNKDAAWTKNDVVNVSAAVAQVQIVQQKILVA